MKRIKYSIFILLMIFISSSCINNLLEEEPITFLSPQSLSSNEGAEALLLGAYQSLQRNNYYNRELILQLEVKTDYAFGRGSYSPPSLYNVDINNNLRIASIWNDIYSGINRVNVIINQFPDLPLEKSSIDQWIAEAKVLRAFHYFTLVRLWGAVPLRTDVVEGLNNLSLAKSSPDVIYEQIVEDLTHAINSNSLPTSYPSSDVGRITIFTAKVLLADVYLTLENYSESATLANDVIQSGKFSLDPDLSKLYSPEDGATHTGEMWSIKYLRINGYGFSLPVYIHNANLGYSVAGYRTHLGNLNSTIIKDWDPNDHRKSLNLYDTDPNTPEGKVLSAAEPLLFKKYIDKNGAGSSGHGNDFPIYRFADALTIFAEADAMAKNTVTPAAYEALNMVKRRAYGLNISESAPAIDYSGLSLSEFRNAVWNERAWEFMMECKRWYDMLRMGREKAKTVASNAGKTLEDMDFLWPIPQQEIENNELLTNDDQNPGY